MALIEAGKLTMHDLEEMQGLVGGQDEQHGHEEEDEEEQEVDEAAAQARQGRCFKLLSSIVDPTRMVCGLAWQLR